MTNDERQGFLKSLKETENHSYWCGWFAGFLFGIFAMFVWIVFCFSAR